MRACEITLNSGYSGFFQIRKTNRKIIFSLSQAIEVSRLYVLPIYFTENNAPDIHEFKPNLKSLLH